MFYFFGKRPEEPFPKFGGMLCRCDKIAIMAPGPAEWDVNVEAAQHALSFILFQS
jgi:hypothetical protein